MDIKLFKTFLLVAKSLNVTQAAEQLNFTQPAVTSQIRLLEEHFGVKLFERIGKKLFLTDAGIHMIGRAEGIMAAYEETGQAMAAMRDSVQELTIGVSTQVLNYFLPPIIREMQSSTPTVSISVRICKNSSDVAKGLLENSLDVGFIHGRNESGQLIKYGVWTEEIIWVCSRELFDSLNGSEDIFQYPLINFSRGTDFRAKFDEVMKTHSFESVIEYSDSEAIKRAVFNGLGIAFLPKELVQKQVDSGNLVRFAAAPELAVRISLLRHKGKIMTPAMCRLFMIMAKHPEADEGLKALVQSWLK